MFFVLGFFLKLFFTFKQHIESCPDRASLEHYKYQVDTTVGQNSRAETENLVAPPIDLEECWDDVSFLILLFY